MRSAAGSLLLCDGITHAGNHPLRRKRSHRTDDSVNNHRHMCQGTADKHAGKSGDIQSAHCAQHIECVRLIEFMHLDSLFDHRNLA